MSPLVWVFVSSVAWVGADVLRKRLAGPIGAAPLGALLSLGSILIFGPWWMITGGTLDAAYAVPAALSLVANIAATLLLIHALHRGELGVVVPLLALTPVLSALGDWLLGGAAPGPRQAVGIGLVVGGALLLQLHGRRIRMDLAAWMAVAVAVLYSMTAVLDAVALRHSPAPLHGLLQSVGMGLGLALLSWSRGQGNRLVPPPGTRLLVLAAVGVFVVGYGAQLVALEQVSVSLHETVKRAIGMLGALVVGTVGFRERPSLQRVGAVFGMLVGVSMVLL